MVSPKTTPASVGLSSREAQDRLNQYGPNAVPEQRSHSIIAFLGKVWGPVPWMLELAIVLELALGRYTQATIMAGLLVLNAALSFSQESRARRALALLRQRLVVQARVCRDSRWVLLPAGELVPGDAVYVRMGDLVPADGSTNACSES
jgi:H+-transporting ATPase